LAFDQARKVIVLVGWALSNRKYGYALVGFFDKVNDAPGIDANSMQFSVVCKGNTVLCSIQHTAVVRAGILA
jgi:hypothetical protein